MIDFKPDRLCDCYNLSKEQIKQIAELRIPLAMSPRPVKIDKSYNKPDRVNVFEWFRKLKHNLIVCCNNTLLYNTNISLELFEYAKEAEIYDEESLKLMLCENAEALFWDDEVYIEELQKKIKKF